METKPHRILAGLLIAILVAGSALAEPLVPLATSFQKPPASARPWVYWFPLSGNLTKAGITADLEAMARVGIGGVLFMEVNQSTLAGAADFGGSLWMDMAMRNRQQIS